MRYFLILLISIHLYAINMHVAYGTASMDQYNKKDTVIAMGLWIDEILQGTQHKAFFTFYDDPKQMAKDLEEEKIDLVIDYGIEFVMYTDITKLENGFTGGMMHREDEHMVLVLPKGKDLDSFYALKNPVVAMQKRENLSRIYVETLLLEQGSKFKLEVLKTKKRSAALLKLFFKKADAAVVTKKTFDFAKELNPQIGKKLKIVKNSNIPAGSFGFFRKGFHQGSKEELIKIAVDIINTKRGAQLLTVFQTDKVVETKIEELEPIKKLYKKYLDLKEKK